MRIPALARLLVPLSLVLTAGCPVYYYPPFPPSPVSFPGNIAVSWTFAGNTCSQPPLVAQVRVSTSDVIPIQPNTFGCSVGILPNQLVLYQFVPGTYIVYLVGLDNTGNTIWTGSGTVSVLANQTTSTAIDLQPAGGSNSTAYLSWSFAPTLGSDAPPCTALGNPDPDRMDTVALYVDGATAAAQTYGCSQGLGTQQVVTPSLSAGPHTLRLVAGQSGVSYPFAQTQPVSVTIGNSPTSQTFTFAWPVGELASPAPPEASPR